MRGVANHERMGNQSTARAASTPASARPAAPRSSGVPGPSFGWESLTGTETRVAHLVALGLTNRQVAKEIFVSRHTVDSHLRHIFRKLGIASRVHLARVVVERRFTPEDDASGT